MPKDPVEWSCHPLLQNPRGKGHVCQRLLAPTKESYKFVRNLYGELLEILSTYLIRWLYSQSEQFRSGLDRATKAQNEEWKWTLICLSALAELASGARKQQRWTRRSGRPFTDAITKSSNIVRSVAYHRHHCRLRMLKYPYMPRHLRYILFESVLLYMSELGAAV